MDRQQPSMIIVIADDDYEERFSKMAQVLQGLVDAEVVWTKSVSATVDKLTTGKNIIMASLDHDFGEGRRSTGLDVVEALAKIEPYFPILVHTSSESPGKFMVDQLRLKGWTAQYVGRNGETPEEWLRGVWLNVVRAYLP